MSTANTLEVPQTSPGSPAERRTGSAAARLPWQPLGGVRAQDSAESRWGLGFTQRLVINDRLGQRDPIAGTV